MRAMMSAGRAFVEKGLDGRHFLSKLSYEEGVFGRISRLRFDARP
jgi:hypothetical protein